MTRLRTVRILLVALALTGASRAQGCFTPDGYSGGCCAIAQGTFPFFPPVTMPGLGSSLLDCAVDCIWSTTTTIAPNQVLCDYWLFGVTIAGAAPGDPSILGATFFGKYVRTWGELTPTGPLQVWRWLVNSDVIYAPPGAGSAAPCKTPFSAVAPFGLPVHLMGHIDYAYDCNTGAWSAAMALTHLCPAESHAAFSARPLAIPPGVLPRTYHFVAPANFVFGPGPSPEGPIAGDAARASAIIPGIPYTCLSEDPIVGGTLTTSYCDCMCATSSIGPPTFHHQTLTATVANCGAAVPITLLPFAPFLPTGLRVHMFGSWTGGPGTPSYPGTKHVGHYVGVLIAPDICPLPPGPFGPVHAVMGVGTAGGNPMILPNSAVPATTEAADLGNMLTFPALTLGLGALFATDRVWSFNAL